MEHPAVLSEETLVRFHERYQEILERHPDYCKWVQGCVSEPLVD